MEFVNKNVKMLDPFSPNLTLEQKEAIYEEAKVNPLYFYDRILGIKASRVTWEVIRTMPTYPGTPGDHDGDMLPEAVKPSSIEEWDKLAWQAWNMTLMHFAHEMSPNKARIQERYEREWLERAPENVKSRVIFKDDRYSEPTFEFKRGNGDWLVKLPGIKERPGCTIRRVTTPSAADIEAGNRNWAVSHLRDRSAQAWNLTCKEFDFVSAGEAPNEKIIEVFALMIQNYDTAGYEVSLTSLVWDEEHSSIWKATPGFSYRKRGADEWIALDYIPSIKATW